MQIVIDIPDYDYRQIKEYYEKNDTVEATYSYIYHGTPLPKGHGDLVDISKLDGEWVCTQDGNYECIKECSCENCEHSEYQCYTEIRNLSVIIEADKAESEDDDNGICSM